MRGISDRYMIFVEVTRWGFFSTVGQKAVARTTDSVVRVFSISHGANGNPEIKQMPGSRR